MKLSVFLWAAVLIVGNVGAQGGEQPVVPSPPVIGGTGDSQMVYPLQLPAGISLISSPLDAGSGPAIDAFVGVDGAWPLFYQWDSAAQRFLGPEESMLAPGAGYWYYAPAPTTLLIFGKPYGILTHLTKDITPGWHLVGVPFIEGIDWSNFHLYASGNPVGLETARELGWVSSDVLTMRGSQWQIHPRGAPFEPGAAYWIRTTVPLSVRATPAAVASAAGVASPFTDSILNNITKVIDNKGNLIKTGADIKAGKLTGGGMGGSGAVFGLANALVQVYRYNNIMDELNAMDDKLDEFLTDMSAVQNQLASIESQIEGLENWLINDARLGAPMRDAEAWIAQFYSDPTQPGQSYNWARWRLAGCDVSVSTCMTTVTDASSQAFNSQYDKFPAKNPPDLATDNFYLWWGYSVLGGQSKIPPYMQNGNTAGNLVQSLHDGMVADLGTSQNGLRAYMEYVFSKSACATDVTACDLYSQVYLPVEAYYQQLITTQITLVQAIVESYSVLASTDQSTHSYDSFISDYMTGFQRKLSDEAEAFVQTAEQIALYRAADGRVDWSSFNTSDAAQLLARADFLAARLVSMSGGTPWPWPPGVTGRIFYKETQLFFTNDAHKACIGSTCTPLIEVVPQQLRVACKSFDSSKPDVCNVLSDWPYLAWSAPDSNNVVSGTPTFTWKVRRLTPQQMAAGTYQVASINPAGGNVNLVVSQYGDDYSNPPGAGTTTVLFGGFNNLEGSLGIGALTGNRTYSGGSDDKLHDFTRTDSITYTQLTVAYKEANVSETGDWYERIKIRVPADAVFNTFPRVRIYWPTSVDISCGSGRAGNCCQDYFYQKVEQSLRLLEADGDSKTGQLFVPCTTGDLGFGSCRVTINDRNDGMMLASPAVTLNHSETYTLQAHYSDKLWGYYGAPSCNCSPYPTSGSRFIWKVFNPTVTLVK